MELRICCGVVIGRDETYVYSQYYMHASFGESSTMASIA